MIRFLIVAMSLLSLSGCVEAGARAIHNADWAASEAEAFVREVDEDREWVRSQCRDILRQQVAQLREDGKYDEAMALLDGAYPPLVTVELVRGAREGEPIRILDRPWPCKPQVTLNLETGLLED